MNLQNLLTKKNLLTAAGVCILAALLFIGYDNLVFRLKSTSPDINNMPTSSVSIRYHFSQPISSVESVLMDGSPINNTLLIESKTVTIPLEGKSLSSDSTYTIELRGVKSAWFNNRIDSINLSFTPRYIDFKNLSKEEQDAQVSSSNSGQLDDPFIATHTFPIFNERWQIDATVIQDSRTAILNVKFFDEIPNYDQGGKVTRVSNDTAEKYRQEVLDEIENLGGDPDAYPIIYDNPYLYEKYSDGPTH